MWILIKANSQEDVGLHEERRILVDDEDMVERNILPFLFAEATALETTPKQGGMSTSELLRKMI